MAWLAFGCSISFAEKVVSETEIPSICGPYAPESMKESDIKKLAKITAVGTLFQRYNDNFLKSFIFPYILSLGILYKYKDCSDSYFSSK